MYSIILCGGSGTRLWPLSRKNYPKQFLNLYSDKSLLQETFLRMKEIMPIENIFFVTNKDNFFNVFNQIRELEADFNKENILTEPKSLNTAPAITYAIKYLLEKRAVDANEPIIMLPSDHYIGKKEAYLKLVTLAMEEVADQIGTIGIVPTKPETGYGYILKGEKEGNYFKVKEFKEKPDHATAQQYLQSGQYVWNAGMYLFNGQTFLEELKAYCPEISQWAEKSFEELENNFEQLPKISVDYAISEKSNKVIVFEGDFGWSDIGSFDELAEMNGKENPKLVSVDSKNVFVHSESDRLVATVGVEDLIVIENADSILIQKKGKGQDVKKVVDVLQENGQKEIEHSLIVHRPWGKFEVLLDNASDHKVKKITVYPGAKLSLQSHFHRVEHWIVIRGMAKVVNGDREIVLNENESTFIPLQTKHRLENPGKLNLEIIEVQTGKYLEEDDIVRYEDVYEREGVLAAK